MGSVTPDVLIGRGLLGEDRFIDAANGRRLRAMVAGEGDDLIVLEAGLGASGLYWGLVHAAIAPHARVVAYERAGYGASTPATGPRDLAERADDLESVIDAFAHQRVVLVGHSWGGPIVRTVAARRHARGHGVHGLVLVDQSDEHAADLYNSRLARLSDAIQTPLMVPLAKLRLLAPLVKSQLVGLPLTLRDAAVASSSTVDAARAVAAENHRLGEALQLLHNSPPELGAVAMSVISGQQDTRLDRAIRRSLLDAHRATVHEHVGARAVAAVNSGHMVPVTEPELIASEALSLLR